MKTIILSLFVMSGLMIACSPKQKQPETIKTPVTDIAAKPVAAPEHAVPAQWQKIATMTGEYMYDSVVFKMPALVDSLKNLLGSEYPNMVSSWNVASELKRAGNVLCMTGCKHDACFKNMWVIMLDIAKSQLNVYHMKDSRMTVYTGGHPINIPEGFESYIKTIEKNGMVASGDIEIK